MNQLPLHVQHMTYMCLEQLFLNKGALNSLRSYLAQNLTSHHFPKFRYKPILNSQYQSIFGSCRYTYHRLPYVSRGALLPKSCTLIYIGRGLNAIHPQHYTPILSSYKGAWHKGVSGSLYHQKFWALQCYGCVPQPPPGAHHQDRISQFVSYFFLVGYFRYLALANQLAGCQLVSRLYIRRAWWIVVVKQEEP